MSGTNLATAYVQLIPSARGMTGNIEKELSGAGASAGVSAGGKFSSAFTKYVSAAAIGTAIFKSITTGAELQQNLGGTEAVFGKFADSIQAKAQTAYKEMGLSASDYMATANKMGSLFQGSGVSQVKSVDMTAKAMQRAADVASVMGIDASMAMESIAGAAKGNFTMMDNLGVAMNATTLQAYALEKGVNFNWNTADNAEKAELAMKMFMDRTSQYAGNYEKEVNDTLSGSFEAVQSALSNLMGNLTLGEQVGPAMEALATTASGFLFKNLIPAIGNIFKSLPTAMGVFLRDGLPQFASAAKEFMNGLANQFSNSGQLISGLMKSMASISKGILNGSGSFIDAGLKLVTNLAQGIADGLPSIIQYAPTIVSNIADVINKNAPKILRAGLNIIKILAVGIIKAIPKLVKSIPRITVAAAKAFMAFSWANIGRNMITKLGSGIKAAASRVFGAVKSIVSRLKGLFAFSFATPKIKVPHFSISPPGWSVGDLVKGKIPSLSVNWRAEGGVLDRATLIGAGEAGREAILPLDRNTGWMDQLANKVASLSASGGVLNVVMTLDGKVIGQSTVDYINGQTIVFGSNPLMV